MKKTLIKVDDLSVSFPNHEKNVVNHISFSVEKGEILGIVGESGSGKSITSLAIMGLLSKEAKVNSGTIEFLGENLITMKEDKRRSFMGDEMSMIFQEPMTSLNPLMKVGIQVEEMLKLHSDLAKEERKQNTLDMLSKVGLKEVESLYEKYPHQLSGGMRQRVMIAMAMILKPKLLIADEPTTALDVTIQAQILKLLKHFHEEYGTSIILISHDLGVIKSICQNAMVLKSGQIIERGTVHNLFYHPKEEYTKRLIGSVPQIQGNFDKYESITSKKIYIEKTTIFEPVLEVENLTIGYKEKGNSIFSKQKVRDIVKDVSFSIGEGEILGIVGESGSGKSTLAKAVVGLAEEISGSIILKHKRPQMVFQDPYGSLNPVKTIGWILEEPLKINTKLSKIDRIKRVKEVLSFVDLEEIYIERYPSELSGGQRQRVAIASAIILNPKLIVLDEPVSALDVTVEAQILELLKDLREKLKLSYLFISHDLRVVYEMCDRVGVMYQGKIVELEEADDLYNHPKHEYTKKLLEAIPR